MITEKTIRSYAKDRPGLREIRVIDGITFPVFLFIYDERDHDMTSTLARNLSALRYSTEDICRWSDAHGVEYAVYISALDRILPVSADRAAGQKQVKVYYPKRSCK